MYVTTHTLGTSFLAAALAVTGYKGHSVVYMYVGSHVYSILLTLTWDFHGNK